MHERKEVARINPRACHLDASFARPNNQMRLFEALLDVPMIPMMDARMRSTRFSPTPFLFGALLLLASMLAARTACAALALSIGNPGLDHFDSDGGVELNFGITDNSGQPVGNLKPENVKVFEDGKQAKIIDFRGVGQGRPVDIVFVMDVTE